MQRRTQIRNNKSKKLFRGTQDLTHKFNVQNRAVRRGGIRL